MSAHEKQENKYVEIPDNDNNTSQHRVKHAKHAKNTTDFMMDNLMSILIDNDIVDEQEALRLEKEAEKTTSMRPIKQSELSSDVTKRIQQDIQKVNIEAAVQQVKQECFEKKQNKDVPAPTYDNDGNAVADIIEHATKSKQEYTVRANQATSDNLLQQVQDAMSNAKRAMQETSEITHDLKAFRELVQRDKQEKQLNKAQAQGVHNVLQETKIDLTVEPSSTKTLMERHKQKIIENKQRIISSIDNVLNDIHNADDVDTNDVISFKQSSVSANKPIKNDYSSAKTKKAWTPVTDSIAINDMFEDSRKSIDVEIETGDLLSNVNQMKMADKIDNIVENKPRTEKEISSVKNDVKSKKNKNDDDNNHASNNIQNVKAGDNGKDIKDINDDIDNAENTISDSNANKQQQTKIQTKTTRPQKTVKNVADKSQKISGAVGASAANLTMERPTKKVQKDDMKEKENVSPIENNIDPLNDSSVLFEKGALDRMTGEIDVKKIREELKKSQESIFDNIEGGRGKNASLWIKDEKLNVPVNAIDLSQKDNNSKPHKSIKKKPIIIAAILIAVLVIAGNIGFTQYEKAIAKPVSWVMTESYTIPDGYLQPGQPVEDGVEIEYVFDVKTIDDMIADEYHATAQYTMFGNKVEKDLDTLATEKGSYDAAVNELGNVEVKTADKNKTKKLVLHLTEDAEEFFA